MSDAADRIDRRDIGEGNDDARRRSSVRRKPLQHRTAMGLRPLTVATDRPETIREYGKTIIQNITQY